MLPPTVEISRLAGVGCPPQPVLGESAIQVGIEDAGFDHGDQVVGAHLEDAVHAAHRQDDLAGPCVRPAGETRARPARDDGRSGGVRDAQRLLHVGDGCRVDDGEGMPLRRVPRFVGPSGLEVGGIGVDTVGERTPQLRDDVGLGCHRQVRRRRPAMSPTVTATTAKAMPIQALPLVHHTIVAAA